MTRTRTRTTRAAAPASAASTAASSSASVLPHRRQRRRFRYRKQARCLVVSFFVLGLGANLLIIVRLFLFASSESKTPETQMMLIPRLVDSNTDNNDNIKNNNINNKINDTTIIKKYLEDASNVLATLLAIVCLFRWLQRLVLVSTQQQQQQQQSPERNSWFRARPASSSLLSSLPSLSLDSSNRNPLLQMTVAETLQAFNRERLARGESTVSPASIEAYESFLRDLATTLVVVAGDHRSIASTNTNHRRISKAQLEDLCPRWSLPTEYNNNSHNNSHNNNNNSHKNHCFHHFLSQTECGICLEAYSDTVDPSQHVNSSSNNNNNNKQVERTIELRTLPCKHTFHAHCIDQWLERSVTCPTCKESLLSSSSSSNENIFVL